MLASLGALLLVGPSGALAFTVDSSHEEGNKLATSSNTQRSDSGASTSEPAASTASVGSSGQSAQSTIVASLSSAITSAAAAAALAAAQSSLSGSDARSLLTSATSGTGSGSPSTGAGHHHQQRSPGIHLALKLADAIPEVPYNILHNMKKLDHAAPFYNVPNKLTAAGSGKESGHSSLIASALASKGGSFGAEQLSALFRSPLWKRIADGYGEFTSEFRSLFRAPAHPMKGPTSSTTKLLRDISVPAMLMLLASAIPSDVSKSLRHSVNLSRF